MSSRRKKRFPKISAAAKLSLRKGYKVDRPNIRNVWKYYKNIDDISVLRGNISINDKKFGIISRNKQDVTSCIIAPIYSRINNCKTFKSNEIDQILIIGDVLYRDTTTVMNLKPGSMIRPHCIYPNFFLDKYNVTIRIDYIKSEIILDIEEKVENDFKDTKRKHHRGGAGGMGYEEKVGEEEEEEELPSLMKSIDTILFNQTNSYVIVQFENEESNKSDLDNCDNRYCFAIWAINRKNYLGFSPYNIDDKGNIAKNGSGKPGIIRFKSKASIFNYFNNLFTNQKFHLYSMKLLRLNAIKMSPSGIIRAKLKHQDPLSKIYYKDIPEPPPPKTDEEEEDNAALMSSRLQKQLKQQEENEEEKEAEERNQEIERQHLTQPAIMKLSQDYKKFSNKVEYYTLSGNTFVENPKKILFTNISALLHLYYVRSFLWVKETIHDIIKFGNTLYDISEKNKLLENDDWIKKISFPIIFLKTPYSILYEKVIYGEVATETPNIIDFHSGVKIFFGHYDIGLVFGPQNVLIWQEQGLYFMFDPKERDELGRKWTREYSSKILDNTKIRSGAACVTWHENLISLANLYLKNVPKKHSNDPFRILKLRVNEVQDISSNIENWIAYDKDKWIIYGKTSICSHSDKEDFRRSIKVLCISLTPLIFRLTKDEDEWDSNDIDELLIGGLEILKISDNKVNQEKALEEGEGGGGGGDTDEAAPVAQEPQGIDFDIEMIARVLSVFGRSMTITILKNVVTGTIIENPDKKIVGLKNGLEMFFKKYTNGVLIINDFSVGIWTSQKMFYILYPYEKLHGKLESAVCEYGDARTTGHAFILRLNTIDMLFDEIYNNLHVTFNDTYNISGIKILMYELAEARPPLQNYLPFLQNAAMLRPFGELHEGHDYFGLRGNKQTLANLIIALAFVVINHAAGWNKEDLVDILKIGDRLYCERAKSEAECKKFELVWEELEPIIIGMSQFSYERNEENGIFKYEPEEEMEIEEEIEGEAEDLDDFGEEEEEVVRDLEKLLAPWESEEIVEAILQSDVFDIAIWKQDGLYFIFDPQANDENGLMTERRHKRVMERIEKMRKVKGGEEEEEEQEEEEEAGDEEQESKKEVEVNIEDLPNDGAAYVAWFTNLKELIEHLISKLPSELSTTEKLTINTLAIKPSIKDDLAIKETVRNFGWRNLNKYALIRGSISQNDYIFPNRNYQHFANCIIAFGFAAISSPEKWRSQILDIILKYGDRLHTKSIKEYEKNNPHILKEDNSLNLNDIVKTFKVYKILFNWEDLSDVENYLCSLNDAQKFDFDISNAPTIEESSGLIISIKGYTNAFWKSGRVIYIFDPHDNNPEGYISNNGSACLMKFGNIRDVHEFYRLKYGRIKAPNFIRIQGIEINATFPSTFVRMPQAPPYYQELSPNQTMFIPYPSLMDAQILKGFIRHKPNLSTSSVALATMVHCHLQYIEYWNSNIFHQIYFLAKYLEECYHYNNSSNIYENKKYKIPIDDIDMNFTLDNVLIHNVTNKSMQGFITINKPSENITLRNGFILFYRNNTHGILTILDYNIPIWNEMNTYYLLNDDLYSDNIGIISLKTIDLVNDYIMNFLKLINIKNLNDTWYELRSIRMTILPIKSICNKPSDDTTVKDNNITGYCTNCNTYNFLTKITQISKKPKQSKPDGEYENIDDNVLMLCSNMPLQKHKFYGTIEFLPSLKAACLISAGMSKLKNIIKWSSKDLNKIMKSGLLVYVNSIAVKRAETLDLDEFEQMIYISNTWLQIIVLPGTNEYANKHDILNTLNYLLQQHKIIYIKTNFICLIVIREESKVYLYDPGSFIIYDYDSTRNKDKITKQCLKENYKSSKLFRFPSSSLLVDYVLQSIEGASCTIVVGPILVYVR